MRNKSVPVLDLSNLSNHLPEIPNRQAQQDHSLHVNEYSDTATEHEVLYYKD